MAEITTVVIGIQARSTSERFPNKIFELIGDKPMIEHVIGACRHAAGNYTAYGRNRGTIASVALLVPEGDEVGRIYKGKGMQVIEGPENDVLTRYVIANKKLKCDYIVRVTADCPLIPDFIILKHIKTAVIGGFDYYSNVDEEARTSIDGYDCEVMSSTLLSWLDENATDPKDREHVTTYARKNRPGWAKFGGTINYVDQSHLKYSVDTPEDLERVREAYDRKQKKHSILEDKYGRPQVHRI